MIEVLGKEKECKPLDKCIHVHFFSPLFPSFSFLFFHYGVNTVRICPGSQQTAQEIVGMCVMLSATPGNTVSAIQSQCIQLSWV